MTGNDLIASSMRLIGVLASGESPSGPESNDSLAILNQMLDSWNAERLAIFTISISEYTLTAGTQTYTLGGPVVNSVNLATTRPAKVEQMSIVSLNNPAQPLELPIDILDEDGWQAIPVKLISSTLPTKCYIDGGFPLLGFNFWPYPSAQVKTRIYSWTPLTAFTLVADNLYPPGYLKAIRYNLAVDLAPEFGRSVPLEVAAQAVLSKGVIQSMNLPHPVSRCDRAAGGGEGDRYNWLSDQPAGR